MYKIKQIPEDFVVIEKAHIQVKEEGRYAAIRVTKKGYNTHKVCQILAEMLRVPLKSVTYAGNKDKEAITHQNFSIKSIDKERIKKINIKNIQLEFLGYINEPISLGDLEGNHFDIIIRNIDKIPQKKETFYNFFGEQRFSINNVDVGRMIIKRDFKKACELIIEQKSEQSDTISHFLENHKNQYVDALKSIQFKILMIYVHAYQSYMWNNAMDTAIKENITTKDIPLIGFDIKYDGKTDDIIKKIMLEEKITQRDFIIREIPDLSPEGGEREMILEVKDYIIGELENDDLNPGMKKLKVSFFLNKGCYATEVIRQLAQ